MKHKLLILSVVISSCVLVAWAIYYVPLYLVGIHQKSVTNSLAEWEAEYSKVSYRQDAIRTAEMLRYVQHYYIPGEGYRSTPEVEDALELQRRKTMKAFIAALRAYTKQDFGDNAKQWREYLNQHQPSPSLPDKVEMGM